MRRSRLRAILGRTQVLRTRLIIIASVLALLCVVACNSDEPTQTPESDENQAPQRPTVEVVTPTPSSTPAPTIAPTPTPTVIPTQTTTAVPIPPIILPPSPTPRPTAAPDPSAPTATPWPDIGSQLPTPRVDPHSLLLDDGRVLFAGGTLILFADDGQVSDLRPHPFLEIYDPESESWNLVDVSVAPLADGNVLVLALQQQEDEDISSGRAAWRMTTVRCRCIQPSCSMWRRPPCPRSRQRRFRGAIQA